MITKLKYLPVNWMNGMSFSEEHLKSEHLSVMDSVRDASALHLTTVNYGLLGGGHRKLYSESFRDNITDERIEIPFCRAITQDGSRIEILNEAWPELNKPLSGLLESVNLDASKEWYVLLIVDPFTRIAEGIEVDEKGPRRKPFTRPAFGLELLSRQDLELDNLANAIPLAKFETVSNGLRKVEEYIPACARINSCEKLMIKYELFSNYLSSLKKYSLAIIGKIRHKRRNKESNRLADDIEALCLSYLDFFTNNYDEFKFTYRDLPPIKLVEFFAKMTRAFSHVLELAFDSSHMLKYFNQYATDASISELNRIIGDVHESNYVHFDILLSLQVVERFLNTMDEIFHRLQKLDYRELAAANVVVQTGFSQSNHKVDAGSRRSRGDVKIKLRGAEENLEDGLVD